MDQASHSYELLRYYTKAELRANFISYAQYEATITSLLEVKWKGEGGEMEVGEREVKMLLPLQHMAWLRSTRISHMIR